MRRPLAHRARAVHRQTKIRDTLNNLILKSPQNWQTSVGLPFFQIEGTVVEWDEVRFDVRLMQRVPYEGVSRMQTSLRRRHRDRVVRRGLALIIESDFVRSKRFDPLRALLCRAAPPISHPCVPLACAVRDRRRPSALCRSCAPRLKLHHCSMHQLTRCVVVRRAHRIRYCVQEVRSGLRAQPFALSPRLRGLCALTRACRTRRPATSTRSTLTSRRPTTTSRTTAPRTSAPSATSRRR